ncbi:hypothetical protein CF98_10495 [Halopseudomonas bauzanensis]|nr:hypothetical protein CF98_10495 [Halopseudomonas bauzanensis]
MQGRASLDQGIGCSRLNLLGTQVLEQRKHIQSAVTGRVGQQVISYQLGLLWPVMRVDQLLDIGRWKRAGECRQAAGQVHSRALRQPVIQAGEGFEIGSDGIGLQIRQVEVELHAEGAHDAAGGTLCAGNPQQIDQPFDLTQTVHGQGWADQFQRHDIVGDPFEQLFHRGTQFIPQVVFRTLFAAHLPQQGEIQFDSPVAGRVASQGALIAAGGLAGQLQIAAADGGQPVDIQSAHFQFHTDAAQLAGAGMDACR